MAGLGEGGATAQVVGSVDAARVAHISISGELDIASVNAAKMDIDRVLDDHPRRVVLDLGKLAFMDSSGIALMVQVANSVESVEIRSCTPIVRRVIEIVGLAGVLGLAP
jgi:anti-sigma B factor antagonist